MIIKEITKPDEKKQISRMILEELTDWFGIKESRENYIQESSCLPFFAVFDDGEPIGFLCLKETGKETVEVAATRVPKFTAGKALKDAVK